MKLYLKFSVLAVISTAVQAQNETDTVKHKDCELDVYYAPLYAKGEPETWTREDIRDHLISRHFDTVPAIPTKDNPSDIVEALIDLWPGPNDPERNIYLIYRNEELPKRPALALETWKKESFWPAERGAVPGTDAFTDVHQTAPGDWSVLADKAKLNKENHIFYGSCGTVNLAKACVSPANVETAPDTAQDSKIYTPPEVNRGDIARALFYAEMRYGDELGFMLSDCPPFSKTTFGYRSELLRWHDADKVSAEELTRNERGCSHWQGNRNIFVDFPQLVNKFYGVPDEVPAGMLQYSQCMGETAGPTATPNDCSSIRPGDISIYVFNSENPDQIALFPVDNIPVTVGSLYITDNAWDGTKLLDVEGTIEVRNSFRAVCFVMSVLPGPARTYGPSITFLRLSILPFHSTRSPMKVLKQADCLVTAYPWTRTLESGRMLVTATSI